MDRKVQLSQLLEECKRLGELPQIEGVNKEIVHDWADQMDLALRDWTGKDAVDCYGMFCLLTQLLIRSLHLPKDICDSVPKRVWFRTFVCMKHLVQQDWQAERREWPSDARQENDFNRIWNEYDGKQHASVRFQKVSDNIKAYRELYQTDPEECIDVRQVAGMRTSDQVRQYIERCSFDVKFEGRKKQNDEMIKTVLCENIHLVEPLKDAYLDFYLRDPFCEQPPYKVTLESEQTIRESIVRMLCVAANNYEYAYVFPLYVFLVFVKEPKLVWLGAENDQKKQDRNRESDTLKNPFRIMLSFPNKQKKQFSERRYEQFFQEIYRIVSRNDQQVLKVIKREENLSKGRILGNFAQPCIAFRNVYHALEPRFGNPYSTELVEDLTVKMEYFVVEYNTSYSPKERKIRDKLQDFLQKTEMGRAIWKVYEILSINARFPLYYGVLPAKKWVNKILDIYGYLFPNAYQPTENISADELLLCYQRIARRIDCIALDLNFVSYQFATGIKPVPKKGQMMDAFSDEWEGLFQTIRTGFMMQQNALFEMMRESTQLSERVEIYAAELLQLIYKQKFDWEDWDRLLFDLWQIDINPSNNSLERRKDVYGKLNQMLYELIERPLSEEELEILRRAVEIQPEQETQDTSYALSALEILVAAMQRMERMIFWVKAYFEQRKKTLPQLSVKEGEIDESTAEETYYAISKVYGAIWDKIFRLLHTKMQELL